MLPNNQTVWRDLLDKAAEAYTKTLYRGSDLSLSEKKQSVLELRNYQTQFKEGGASALSLLREELYSQDGIYRNISAEMLIEMRDLVSLKSLSESIINTQSPQLKGKILERLWLLLPPKTGDFIRLLDEGRWEREPLLKTILSNHQPSDWVVKAVESSNDARALKILMDSISRWPNAESLLLKYMGGSSLDMQVTNIWNTDARILAAFYLGMKGVIAGIDFLINIANHDDELQAVQACQHLAFLASPAVVKPLKSLLHSSNHDVVAISLLAASDIGVAGLINNLALLTQNEGYSPIFESFIGDEAAKILKKIVGGQLVKLQDQYVLGSIPEHFTNEFREYIAFQSVDIAKSLDFGRRYRGGEPLTMATLVDDLYKGNAIASAYNLRAITGEDYGYEVEWDLLDNVDAIVSWERRAVDPYPLTPGGWAYMGKPLVSP